jgi:hypothetical protein
MGRRLILRITKSEPAAAAKPILFVKPVTPAPYLLPDPFEGHDFSKAMSPAQFDIVIRAVHDGCLTFDDAGRAADAWTCGRPVPDDMRMVVVAGSQ